jgi:hypothetical protein
MGTAPPGQDLLDHRGGHSTVVFVLAGDFEDVAAISDADPAAGEDLAAEVPVVVPKEVRIAHRRLPDRAGGPAGRLA